jgi:hypothetical protein
MFQSLNNIKKKLVFHWNTTTTTTQLFADRQKTNVKLKKENL